MNPALPTPDSRLTRHLAVAGFVADRLHPLGISIALTDASGNQLADFPAKPVTDESGRPLNDAAGEPTPGPAPELPPGHVEACVPLEAGPAPARLHARAPGFTFAGLTQLLSFTARDARREHDLSEAVDQLSDKLASIYEQSHVLFGLGRIMDGVEDPLAGVQRVLREFSLATPFSWLALQFLEDSRLDPAMRGTLVTAGTTAGQDPAIARAGRLLLEAGLASLRIVPDSDPLLEQAGLRGETVAVALKYDNRICAALLAGGNRSADPSVSTFETLFLQAGADLIAVFHENVTRLADRRALFLGTVRALTSSIDAKHPYTRGHSERVALLVRLLAQSLALPAEAAENWHLAGLLHDVGKIGVPEHILSKPGRLTEDEFAAIRRHPEIGYDILRGIPSLDPILPGVLHHHEKFTGGGYPHGIAGDAIPLVARALALADTFDAMSSSRSYRDALARSAVLAEIARCAGSQFDPDLASDFLRLDFSPYDTLFETHRTQYPQPLSQAAA